MTYIDEGTYGAKRVSWDDNYRRLLRQIIATDPDAKDWFEEFRRQCRDDEDMDHSVYKYAYANAMLALGRVEKSGPTVTPAGKASRAATAREVAAVTTKVRVELLLNLIMANGKRLGDCTGAECRKFSGWYARIAKIVPPRKLVSQVLDEARVTELWKQSQK